MNPSGRLANRFCLSRPKVFTQSKCLGRCRTGFFSSRGQSAMEYLLIVGGAMVVGGIVLVLVLSTTSGGSSQTTNTIVNSLCTQQAAFGSDPRCGGEKGVVIFNNKAYICEGSSPNCTARYVREAYGAYGFGTGTGEVTPQSCSPEEYSRAGWLCFLDAAAERSINCTLTYKQGIYVQRQVFVTYGVAEILYFYNCGEDAEHTYPYCIAIPGSCSEE